MAAEVAVQQLKGIRATLEREGVSLDELVATAGCQPLDWSDTTFRLDWTDYAAILDAVGSVRDAEWFAARGADSIHDDEAYLFRSGLLIGFDEPGSALDWMCRPYGPFAAVSPYLATRLECIDARHFRLEGRMRFGLRPSAWHHAFTSGVLEAFPAVLFEENAQVTIDHLDDGADYEIRFASTTPEAARQRAAARATPQPEYLVGVGETYLALVEGQRGLQQAQRERHLLERRAALADVARGVAHDFNNVLTVAMAHVDLLRSELEGTDADTAEEVLRVLQGGTALTRRLHSLAREVPDDTTTINVGEVLTTARSMFLSAVGDGVTLEIDTPDDLPPVLVDRGELDNALLNLIVNAGSAIGDEGRIRMTARVEDVTDASAGPGLLAAGTYVAIGVSDNGAGIAPELHQRIFDPYFSTKGAAGTGLGLALVAAFARQHGGEVRLQSDPGAGSTFEILLPTRLE